MVHGRRKVTVDEAAELVSAWRASKRALPEWCATHGIDGRSLRYWADRLSSPTSIRLMEVTVAPSRVPSALRVCIDEVTIEVPDDVNADTLAGVLAVVRGC